MIILQNNAKCLLLNEKQMLLNNEILLSLLDEIQNTQKRSKHENRKKGNLKKKVKVNETG